MAIVNTNTDNLILDGYMDGPSLSIRLKVGRIIRHESGDVYIRGIILKITDKLLYDLAEGCEIPQYNIHNCPSDIKKFEIEKWNQKGKIIEVEKQQLLLFGNKDD